jgi:hypothetical protein
MYGAEKTTGQIADWLNRRGHKTLRWNSWTTDNAIALVERSVTHFGLARRGFARSFTRAQPLARTFRSQPYSFIEIAI